MQAPLVQGRLQGWFPAAVPLPQPGARLAGPLSHCDSDPLTQMMPAAASDSAQRSLEFQKLKLQWPGPGSRLQELPQHHDPHWRPVVTQVRLRAELSESHR